MYTGSKQPWGDPAVKSWGNPDVKSWANPDVKSWANPDVKSWANPDVKSWAAIVKTNGVKEVTEDTNVEQDLGSRIELLKTELFKREHAFKHSYAFTKYVKDSERLMHEIAELHTKQELEYYTHILNRILDYLGPYYLHNYYTETRYAATYVIRQSLPPNILHMGITWSIVERHGSIHLIFNVDSKERYTALESLIKTLLPDFTEKIDPL
jgi:hypothetical protein